MAAAQAVDTASVAEAAIAQGRQGLDRHVPDSHWQQIVGEMAASFRAGRFEEGLLAAIDAVDALLVVHFPHDVHVSRGVSCVACHGQVNEMPLMWKTQSLQMQWCLDCHRDPVPNIRPREAVTDLRWEPPAGFEAERQLRAGEATAIAVGSPSPTSRANVGPDSTAIGTCGPSTSPTTWWGSLPVASSKPEFSLPTMNSRLPAYVSAARVST